MDQQPKQRASSSPMMWVGLVVIVLLVVAGAWYFLSKDKTTTNTNQQVNVNSFSNVNSTSQVSTKEYSGKYESSVTGLSFTAPDTVTIKEKLTTYSDSSYFSFDLTLESRTLDSSMVITNREIGFEQDKLLKEDTTLIGGKTVRRLEVESLTSEGQTTKVKRYFFYPLNDGTKYETYWISYPIDTKEQEELFGSIVATINLE